MATIQGQDIICCQLCPNPVKHHCNLCHVDLCPSCIAKHMSDQSREHEVVGYTSRKRDTVILPTCSTHEKKQCETYCQDCNMPICIKCLIESHKGHEVTEINNFLQKQKQRIIADIKKLENIIVSKYGDINSTTTTAEFNMVQNAIEEQEKKFNKAIHEIGSLLKDNINKQKEKAVSECKETQSLRNEAKREINHIIQNNKDILKCKDATAIINYQSTRNLDFQGPELQRFPCPQFIPGSIRQEQLAEIFGYLTTGLENSSETSVGGFAALFGGGSKENFVRGSPATFGQESQATFGQRSPATFGQGYPAKFGQRSPATFGQGYQAPFGQGSPASFGQRSPATFGQRSPATFGQRSPATFGQRSPANFGQGSSATFGQGLPATFGQGSPATFGQGSPAMFGQGSPATFGQRSPATFGQRPKAVIKYTKDFE